jgi:hypothetical protein
MPMKKYLVTTGILFGLMTVVHAWRAVVEWAGSAHGAGFILGMAALIVLPGLLSFWAWYLLRKIAAS